MFNENIPNQNELPNGKQLLRSTVIALLVALTLLITVVMPSEYAIDHTGVGRLMGLTQMGEIKEQLANDAARDSSQHNKTQPAELQTLTQEVNPHTRDHHHGSDVVAGHGHTHDDDVIEMKAEASMPVVAKHFKADAMHVELAPNQGAEIKLEMMEGSQVNYEWRVEGGTVNYDTHGDPYDAPRDFYHGYGKGRSVSSGEGDLVAAFDGNHGWFWRNRSGKPVVVILKTQGDYLAIKRMI